MITDTADVSISIDQSVLKALMIPFGVIMFYVCGHGPPQRLLAKENHAVETFRFQASHEPFDVGVEIRTSGRKPQWFAAIVVQQLPE